MKRLSIVLMILAVFAFSVAAQDDMMMTPEVQVSEQVVLNDTVTIDYAVINGPGFIVIHADNGEGAPGPVIGNRLLSPGENYNVSVPIDAAAATPTLFAMLHVDDNEIGVYEFGQVEGADAPVIVDNVPVTPPFNVAVLNANDQFVDGAYTAASVTVDSIGWLVVHADNGEGAPGPVIGFAPLEAGTNTDVTVELDAEGTTPTLFPMLHVDTGEEGTYEFGQVEGADGPIALGGQVAVTGVNTFPTVRMDSQIVMGGDGMEMMMDTPTATADSVLSEGPGWLVIHADNGEGAPGPVIGFTAVADGYNEDVTVELDAEGLTPVLFPMLHVDTGEEGTYEFGQVEGADGPVTVDGSVLTFPIDAAPAITYTVTAPEGGLLVVESALIDAPGWLVIHADNGEGAPGPVIGFAPMTPGLNTDITVTVDDTSMMTETVFPMLHYDTGEAGVYEFGSVDGADLPVSVNESVVVGPATPEMME